MTAKKKSTSEDKSLEEMLKEAEKQINSLENDDITLEDSFECYKKGMEILKTCSERIDRTEKKVLEISEDGGLKQYNGEE